MLQFITVSLAMATVCMKQYKYVEIIYIYIYIASMLLHIIANTVKADRRLHLMLIYSTATQINGHDDIVKCIISMESKVYSVG